MNTKKFKELVPEYTYEGLGFPVVLKDVIIVEDRGYEYPLINHNGVMFQAACSLITEHQKLDGARLYFIRRFMNLSLEQFSEVIGGHISKSTIHKWESEKVKVCEFSNELLRLIYCELKDKIISQIGKEMNKVIAKDFPDSEEIPPLNIDKNNLIAS